MGEMIVGAAIALIGVLIGYGIGVTVVVKNKPTE